MATPRDGVPWDVIVEPSVENPGGWKKAGEQAVLPMLQAVMCRENDNAPKKKSFDAVPAIEMPDILWKQRIGADLQDVSLDDLLFSHAQQGVRQEVQREAAGEAGEKPAGRSGVS